jgi:2,5-diketo-D-gluconate reductase A
MTLAPTRTLLDGHEMPVLGLGTGPFDDSEAAATVARALTMGYRLLDTAARYGNEIGVGRGIAASGVPREEVFVTTKLRGSQQGYEAALAAFEESRRRLGLEYVDLYLIHWPLPRLDLYVESWQAMIHLRDEGLIRSIGVSNFTPAHIDRLAAETSELPVVDQIELHPDFAQPALVDELAERGVVAESWSPLGRKTDILQSPELARIAAAHGRSVGQIVLRWHVERGTIPIPKSADPGRLADNLDVFDFALSDEDLRAIAALDSGNRVGGDPDVYEEL